MRDPATNTVRIRVAEFNDRTADAPVIEQISLDDGVLNIDMGQLAPTPQSQVTPDNTKFVVWIKPVGYTPGPDEASWDEPAHGRLYQAIEAQWSGSRLTVALPPGVALSAHELYVERLVKVETSPGRFEFQEAGTGSRSGAATFQPKTDVSFTTSAFGIRFFKHVANTVRNADGTLTGPDQQLQLVKEQTWAEAFSRLPLELRSSVSAAVGGWKTDQIAFNDAGTLAFIASYNGRVMVLDMASLDLVDIIEVGGGSTNIASIAVAGDHLYIAEGDRYVTAGRPEGGYRLMRVNIDLSAPQAYGHVQQIRLPSTLSNTVGGYADLAVNRDAQGRPRYLAVTVATGALGINRYDMEIGKAFVLDLVGLEAENQLGTARWSASLTASRSLREIVHPESRGRGTQFVVSGSRPGDFLFTNAFDGARGAVSVSFALDPQDGSLSATPTTRVLNLDTSGLFTVGKYRLNFQRTQGVAVTEFQGNEYAFIADYHLPYLDLSNAGRQVGGKIAVVKDPFGRNGQPEFLGTTTPFKGGTLDKLTLSPDGSQLWATYMHDEGGLTGTISFGMLVFDAQDLIIHAQVNSLNNRSQTAPLPFDRMNSGGDQIPSVTPHEYGGHVVGMAPKRATLNIVSANGSPDGSLVGSGHLARDAMTAPAHGEPVFYLQTGVPLTGYSVYVSTFGPGDGLWPQDKPLELFSLFGGSDASGDLSLLQRELLADSNPGRVATAHVNRSQAASDDPFRVDLAEVLGRQVKLTAGQTYWVGVEGRTASGSVVRTYKQFTVAPVKAEFENQFSSVTILTPTLQTPFAVDEIIGGTYLPEFARSLGFEGNDTLTGTRLMAAAMAEKSGATVLEYDPRTGGWIGAKGTRWADVSINRIPKNGGALILIANWLSDASTTDTGFAEGAADALFASLVELHRGTAAAGFRGGLLNSHLHFIGHGRGAVVNSEIIQRLGRYADSLQQVQGVNRESDDPSNRLDLHMTTLDPFDGEQRSLELDFGAMFGRLALVGTAATLSGSLALAGRWAIAIANWGGLFVDAVLKPYGLDKIAAGDYKDPDIKIWENVTFADNYYQEIPKQPGDQWFTNVPVVEYLYTSIDTQHTGTPYGHSMWNAGAAIDVRLDGRYGFHIGNDDEYPIINGIGTLHQRVATWYLGTANLALRRFSDTKPHPAEGKADPILRGLQDYGRKVDAFGGDWLYSNYNYTFDSLRDWKPWYSYRVSNTLSNQTIATAAFVQAHGDYTSTVVQEGLGEGWAYSVQGGGLYGADSRAGLRPLEGREPVIADNTERGRDLEAVPGVFNGNFEAGDRTQFGRFPIFSWNLPGWSRHNWTKPVNTPQLLDEYKERLSNDLDQGVDVLDWNGLRQDWWDAFKRDYLPGFTAGLYSDIYQSIGELLGKLRKTPLATGKLGLDPLEVSVNAVVDAFDGFRQRMMASFARHNVPGGVNTVVSAINKFLDVAANGTKQFPGANIRNLTSAAFFLGAGPSLVANFLNGYQSIAEHRVELGGGDELWHNRMYFPIDATSLSFDLASDSLETGTLEVVFEPWSVGGTAATPPSGLRFSFDKKPVALLDGAYQQIKIAVPEALRGQVGTFYFKVSDDTWGSFYIDNIRLGSDLEITDSSAAEGNADQAKDRIVFFKDFVDVDPQANVGDLRTTDPFVSVQQHGVDQHKVTLRNSGAERAQIRLKVDGDAFLQHRTTDASTGATTSQLMDGNWEFARVLEPGEEYVLDLRAHANEDLLKKLAGYDQESGTYNTLPYDVAIAFARLQVETSPVGSGVVQKDAVSLYYMIDLSDASRKDGVVHMRDLRTGTDVNLTGGMLGGPNGERALRVYNPGGMEIAPVAGAGLPLNLVEVKNLPDVIDQMRVDDPASALPPAIAAAAKKREKDTTLIIVKGGDARSLLGSNLSVDLTMKAAGVVVAQPKLQAVLVEPQRLHVNSADITAQVQRFVGYLVGDTRAQIDRLRELEAQGEMWPSDRQRLDELLVVDAFKASLTSEQLQRLALLQPGLLAPFQGQAFSTAVREVLYEGGDGLQGVFHELWSRGDLEISTATRAPASNENSLLVKWQGEGEFTGTAGTAGQDLWVSELQRLLMSGDSVRSDLQPQQKLYLLSKVLNGDRAGALSDPTKRAMLYLGQVLRDVLVDLPSDADTDLAWKRLGQRVGWVAAHEFAHNLGLPDAYVQSGGVRQLLDLQESLMSQFGMRNLTPIQQNLLALALDAPNHGLLETTEHGSLRGRTVAASDIDGVIQYLYNLSNGRRVNFAPSEGEAATGSGGDQPTDSGGFLGFSTTPETGLASAAGVPATGHEMKGLEDATSWQARGTIDWQDGGAAVLHESDRVHSGLRQTFVVMEGQRYLTFTVSDHRLGEGGASIADAFEFALRDAADGRSVLPSLALSRTDAGLNQQGGGQQYLSSGVLARDGKTQGSTTYYVDITEVARGTALELSFDLIGFGVADGYVKLKDVQLLGSLNTAPVLQQQQHVELGEDGVSQFDPLAKASDAEGNALTAHLVTPPAHGSLTLRADGSFDYQPQADFHGEDSFSYRVSDGQLESTIATVRMTVRPVNDLPVVQDITSSVEEDGSVHLDLVAGAIDVDGDSLAPVIVAAPAHGVLTTDAEGRYTYTPAPDFHGSDSFTYRISDGQGESQVATVWLTVMPVNDAPVVADQAATLAEDGSLRVDLLAGAQDVDADVLAPVVVSGPRHGSLTLNADGSFSYSAHADYHGEDSFTYRVSDGQSESSLATVTLTVSPVNDAPIAQDGSATLAEDGSAVIDLRTLGLDVDTLVLQAVVLTGPLHGTLLNHGDGTFTYTPAPNFYGRDSLRFALTDGDLVSNEATFTFHVTAVNDAPVIADGHLTVSEDGVLRIDPLAGVTDVDGDALSADVVAGPAHGSLSLNTDGSFTYTPTADFEGSDSFTYRVSDGTEASNLATVTLTVTGVNDAPVAQDGRAALDEDGAVVVDLRALGLDVEGAQLQPVVVAGPSHGTLVDNGDGTFTYTPAPNFKGRDSVRFTLSDGELTSNEATFSFDVTAVNDAPVVADSHMTVDEDGVLRVDPLAGSSDVDGDALAAAIVAGPAHGSVSVNADGSFSYTPVADFNGSDSFTYRVSDGQGGSELATVTLTVVPVNDAPVVAGRHLTVSEDGALHIDPLAGATDVDGDALTAAVVAGPAHGSLSVNADGSFTYTPVADFNGSDSFTYRVDDGAGASTLATVTLGVTAVNDAPVAQDGSAMVTEDGSVVIDLRSLGFDVDADAELQSLVVAGPSHGTLMDNGDGTYTYTPAPDFNGSDRLRFALTDGELVSNEATFSFEVTAVNDAPVLADAQLAMAEDGVLRLDLLAGASDVDGDTLTATVIAGAAHGLLTVNADGSFSYTPAADFNGTDSFTYRVGDGTVDSNVATVTLNVQSVNDAPVARDAALALDEDGTLHIDFAAYGLDVDSSAALTAVIVDGPAHGSLVRGDDGRYVYVPHANYHGTDAIRFRLSDGELGSNEATLSITVAAVNDAPTLADSTLQMAEDGSVTADALAQATDVDGDVLTLELVEGPAHGTVTIHPDGSYTYVPNANFYGVDTFSLRVSDGPAASAVASVSVNIEAVNDAAVAFDSTAIGEEDQALVLAWSDFDVVDVDGDAMAIRITTLPAEGVLQRHTADGTWLDVVAGETFTQAEITAGVLHFVPEANASGGEGYVHAGYGNRRSHYARLGYVAGDGLVDTAEVFVNLDITALADAPTLNFTGANSSTRELFRTGWEGAPNVDSQSTLVQQSVFDGWRLITDPDPSCGGQDGFEVWNTGDRMADAYNNLRTVRAGEGNGNQWLELNNAGGAQHQTLGIERTVETVAGASYTLSFDVAGRLGFGSDYTRIAVYLDGVKLASVSPTSPSSSLDWRTLSYSFTGTGGAQRLRIVSEATRLHEGGRGTMIDDIALSETTQLNRGSEDSRIPLQGIAAALADNDGSETMVLTMMGLPIGSVLSDGVRSFTVTEAARVANLSGWNTATLALQPPANFSGVLQLQVQATAIETATGGRATVSKQLAVQVAAVADAPVLTLTARDVDVSREMLSTSWESVANRNRNATIVAGAPWSTLEGWRVMHAEFGKQTAFEIWSSGDQMRNAAGQFVTVQAAAGNGRNWLELNNGIGEGHQTLGIERDVQTIAGAIYTLSFDYAGALGLPEANTRVGIYVDGQLVGSYANTSGATALNWRALSFQFTGNGCEREISIRIEGGPTANHGRGAMIDDIRIVETLPTGNHLVYGLAGTAIALPIVNASLTDTDGSETLKVELLGLPAGATVSDGTRSVTLTSAGSVDLSGWNLALLSLTPPAGCPGLLSLQVRATSTEASNGSSTSVTQSLQVCVLGGTPVDTPVGVNPYVVLTAGTSSTTTAAATGTVSATPIVVGPMVDETGALTISLALSTPRTWEEEEAAERERSSALNEEWLQELEQFARANWEALVG
ncbi:tandem-95 repeat protein [Caldimonas brevitalea]|uniref:tandem-95 repeat protein n=1 Tax=Caldimonas brevitalea TaxID=413882 RepID=UPI000A71C74E|nr:Ig-like domain-containing protein [Caldimonas brevitalea]